MRVIKKNTDVPENHLLAWIIVFRFHIKWALVIYPYLRINFALVST